MAASTAQACPDSPTNCQNLVSNPSMSGMYTFHVQSDHTYWLRVWVTDRVDKATTAESGPYGTASLTKYYLFGGQRVAMRQGDAVYYLHGDHLGSTSLTTDITGQLVRQARYTPFGGLHWEGGAAPTDFGFTGQRAERGMGLMDFNARFYAVSLGRFVSADSIVPGAGRVMAWDRYAGMMNNPIRYNDPSGHLSCDSGNPNIAEGDCSNWVNAKDIKDITIWKDEKDRKVDWRLTWAQLKDDPVELITRAILAEEGVKIGTDTLFLRNRGAILFDNARADGF